MLGVRVGSTCFILAVTFLTLTDTFLFPLHFAGTSGRRKRAVQAVCISAACGTTLAHGAQVTAVGARHDRRRAGGEWAWPQPLETRLSGRGRGRGRCALTALVCVHGLTAVYLYT